MPDFYTVITDNGLRSLGLATSQGQNFSLTHAVVGDGNGALVMPNKSMTSLVHEVWRGVVSGVHSTEAEPNTLIFEFVIKADVGGFTIREVGLLDENGELFCIGNFPETEKPVVADGSVRDLVIRLPLHFENAESVNLTVDTNVAVAIKKDVIDHNADPQAHSIMKSDAVDLNSSEKVATSKAVKTTYDSLTAHKANISAHGIVKSDAVNSASSDFATSKAVKTVHDQIIQHAVSVDTHADATTAAKGFVRFATDDEHKQRSLKTVATSPWGVWKLLESIKSDAVTLSSSVTLATAKAVKTLHDALEAHKATATHLPSGGNNGDVLRRDGSSAKWEKLALVPAGHIYPVPFPPDELPQHHYVPNGEGLLKTSPQGQCLLSMSPAYKTAHRVTENATHVFLPNVFDTNGDGFFPRFVDGVSRTVGSKQGDAIRNIKGEVKAAGGDDFISKYGGDKLITTGAFDKISRQCAYAGTSHYSCTSGAGFTFDTSRTVPTAHENRSKNYGFVPAIYLPPQN